MKKSREKILDFLAKLIFNYLNNPMIFNRSWFNIFKTTCRVKL